MNKELKIGQPLKNSEMVKCLKKNMIVMNKASLRDLKKPFCKESLRKLNGCPLSIWRKRKNLLKPMRNLGDFWSRLRIMLTVRILNRPLRKLM